MNNTLGDVGPRAHAGSSGRSVRALAVVGLAFLVLPGMAEDMVLNIKVAGVPSSGGQEMWNNESWFTLNALTSRAWDASMSTALAPKAPSPAFSMAAVSRQGILEVTFSRQGAPSAVDAVLYAPSGAKLAEASGIPGGSPLRFARPAAGPGVYLLKARARGAAGSLGNASATLRVCF